ncbi:hypothetical protein NDA18_001153 [Ustilago nuda]|nr:hypothetical protein NDA18_001153 [Ustilago nuda]
MRRPAPPPADNVELDYGSSNSPEDSAARLGESNEAVYHPPSTTSANEVGSSAVPTPSAVQLNLTTQNRKLPPPYDDDAFDQYALQSSGSRAQHPASNGLESLESGEVSDSGSAIAVAGPSSPRHQQAAEHLNRTVAVLASTADLWESNPLPQPQPLPPPFSPPALSRLEEQYRLGPYAYHPSVPEFRPNLHQPAPSTLQPEAYPYYPVSAAQSFQHKGYPHMAGSRYAYPDHDLPYDPRAPYTTYTEYTYGAPRQFPQPYSPYLPSAPYPAAYHSDPQGPYAGSHHTSQMDRYQKKRLEKQEKKQKKRENKREAAAAAAWTAISRPYQSPSSSATFTDPALDPDSLWIEDGKAQAVAMISELNARGVAPQRLAEKGVPLAMIESCCVELNVTAQGSTTPAPLVVHNAASSTGGAKEEKFVGTTPAEGELLPKEEQGIQLTPLEELRRKVLASRMAKAAAASAGASDAASSAADNTSGFATTPSSNVFDRTATSGEADALLSQIGESIRSLIRIPSPEALAAASWETPVEAASQNSATTSRKRSYRDVDAVDNEDASLTADLAGDDIAVAPAPSRRQRISYADNFSRAAEIPSGEVDLDAPMPDLPDFSETIMKSPSMADIPARHRRPVAADFDTAEYRPQCERPNRFLDVPSGLNTVIDMSDDEEMEEEELGAFEAASGWTEAQLVLDPREVLLLRQKTASEHYDNFCALNKLQPMRRAVTPQKDGPKSAEAGIDASASSTMAARDLLAQVAASDASSAGSATPSREGLLRKELEIKQLMRKIQMMEDRKSKQQPSPTVSPMPARILQTSAANSQAQHTNGIVGSVPAPMPVSAAAASKAPATSGVGAALPQPAEPPERGQSQGTAPTNLRLDPALQKQRENLLALLANKRKAASTASNGPGQVNGSTENENRAPITVATAQEEQSDVAQGEFRSEDSEDIAIVERKELARQASAVSRYRPLVPSLFQSVATRVRSYLPPSLGFSFSSSSTTACTSSSAVLSTKAGETPDERVSVKWCPREADGHECTDSSCTQRHISEFDQQT